MTAVCSVGIDMVVIPGDTPAEVISALIADEAAIGMVNSKTTAVRVIPAIGREAGEVLDFGGLLGYAPIMPISKYSPAVIIRPRRAHPRPHAGAEELSAVRTASRQDPRSCINILPSGNANGGREDVLCPYFARSCCCSSSSAG